MKKVSKRLKKAREMYDSSVSYSLRDAVSLIKKLPLASFDETLDLAFKLGVDARHADQVVRGVVVLPHGLGRSQRVLVFAKGEKAQEAQKAGADYVGDQDLIAKIESGWLDFDSVVAVPEMMKDIAKIGRILGTKGLMPNPKVGTVTQNIDQTVKELKAGRLSFRVNKANDIHVPVGKVSFTEDCIVENVEALIDAVVKAKPSAAKGQYLRKISLSSTMGCGIKLNI
ncbi:50S ribosomal protein L1 [PVC group bacterium (ex Bugula neritina AB1)]|nr:50S ribosomal protein L1 [PVC group bacterium (ex Bugula neritina AB1)]